MYLKSARAPIISLNILQLGPLRGTCLDRANAFRRLGHSVHHLDPRGLLPGSRWVDRVTWRLGGACFAPIIANALPRELGGDRFDVCHVESGEWITAAVIEELRRYCARIVSYSIDDPLGGRDGARFRVYRCNLAHYDLCVVVRASNEAEARSRGARAVLRVFMSADEVTHAPRPITSADRVRWAAEVQFLGTWFPERGRIMLELIKRGVPLTIRGSNWHKAPEWEHLRPYCEEGELLGDDYAKAIQCAKVNIGLVSRGNRDLHTTRTMEIPALGALLCAERTSEHVALYEEGREALFWESPDECAAMCRHALADDARREAIAAAGRTRLADNGHYNETVLQRILTRAMQVAPAK